MNGYWLLLLTCIAASCYAAPINTILTLPSDLLGVMSEYLTQTELNNLNTASKHIAASFKSDLHYGRRSTIGSDHEYVAHLVLPTNGDQLYYVYVCDDALQTLSAAGKHDQLRTLHVRMCNQQLPVPESAGEEMVRLFLDLAARYPNVNDLEVFDVLKEPLAKYLIQRVLLHPDDWNEFDSVVNTEKFDVHRTWSMYSKNMAHQAAEYGGIDVLERIGNYYNISLNIQDGTGRTPLFYAAEAGKVETVDYLIEQGLDVNARNSINWTALHVAIRYGQVPVVQHLLARGADVNAQTNLNWTPLHYAVRYGFNDVVRMLLANKANPNLKDYENMLPLHFAAEYGRVEAASLLLSKTKRINSGDKWKRTVLHYAAENGREELVVMILEEDVDPNARDHLGMTPLHYAVEHGRLRAVQKLIQHGASVRIANREGKLPIHYVTRFSQQTIASVLIQAGSPSS